MTELSEYSVSKDQQLAIGKEQSGENANLQFEAKGPTIAYQKQQSQIVEQNLLVSVIDKKVSENPQLIQKKQQIQSAAQTQQIYGPFHKLTSNSREFLQKNQTPIYEINIEPVLSIGISPSQNRKTTFKNKNARKTQNILTQESMLETAPRTNPQELERQILELAKNIRQKVWKKQSPRMNGEQSVVAGNWLPISKKTQQKSTGLKIKKIYEKRQSLFEKYSYPRSAGVELVNPIKTQERVRIGKYDLSRVHHQEQDEEQSQPQTQQTNSKQSLPAEIRSPRSKFRTQQSYTTRKQPQLPKLKLNFDKTHHKYKPTEFRKNILRQNKEREIAKSLVIREKQETLQKRRQIYNNSRYNPVGIRLSSLKTQKLHNATVQKARINKNNQVVNQQQTQLENKIFESSQNYMAKSIEGVKTPNFVQQHSRKEQQFSTLFTASGANSSLTFQFSFGQPQSQLKTQAQVYSQVDSLAKMLENDSTPEEKIFKLTKAEQLETGESRQQRPGEKWDSAGVEVNKQMSHSRTIQQGQRLHRSSEEGQEEDQKQVQLQYSYV